MTNILDQVARSSSAARYGQFQPSDQREYFALRLAQKLDDAAAARHYGELLEHYSEAQLLAAYRRAKAAGSHLDPARSFHLELKRLEGRTGDGPAMRRLAAIRIERRAVAVAILAGVYSKAGKDTCKYSCFMRFRRAAAYYPRWVLQSCSSPSDSARAC